MGDEKRLLTHKRKLLVCILGGFASLIVLLLGALALNGWAIQVGDSTAAWMALAGLVGTMSSFAALYSHRKQWPLEPVEHPPGCAIILVNRAIFGLLWEATLSGIGI